MSDDELFGNLPKGANGGDDDSLSSDLDSDSDSDDLGGLKVVLDHDQVEKQSALQGSAAGPGRAPPVFLPNQKGAMDAHGMAAVQPHVTAFSIPKAKATILKADGKNLGADGSKDAFGAGGSGAGGGSVGGQAAGGGEGAEGKQEDGASHVSLVGLGPEPLVGQSGAASFDIDIEGMEEKPWDKPGADVSDYFNYGFTEETWKTYCGKQIALRLEATMQAPIRTYESATPMAELPVELQAVAKPSAFPVPNRANPNSGLPELGEARNTRPPRERPVDDVIELGTSADGGAALPDELRVPEAGAKEEHADSAASSSSERKRKQTETSGSDDRREGDADGAAEPSSDADADDARESKRRRR